MTSPLQSIPSVLTIAGSDSGGGAGIQADIKTFTALKCYGASVITALTAQNTVGVQAVYPCPPHFVEKQLSSVLDDLDIKVIKTGMLYDADTIRAVVGKLRAHYCRPHGIRKLPSIVCDPVSVSTSGHSLLAPDAIEVLLVELIPLSTVITPNKQEAELLLSCRGFPSAIDSLEAMLLASFNLASLGAQAVLLKGGHMKTTLDDIERLSASHPQVIVVKDDLLDDNMEILQHNLPELSPEVVVDILQNSLTDGHEDMVTTLFVRPRINSTSTHGTGCTLSAAIAGGLAKKLSLFEAVRGATIYTHRGIEAAFPVGSGNGPLNHLHSIIPRLIPQASKSIHYPFTHLLIKSCYTSWKSYVQHPFVRQLGKGTLDRKCFIHFMKQDYQYLKYYARAYALLAAKSSTFAAIDLCMGTIENISYELSEYSGRWGIAKGELEDTPESEATTAYGAFLMDVGLQGDSAKVTIALAACLLGYGEVGLWLIRESKRSNSWVVMDKDSNPYLPWIEVYSGEKYQRAVKIGLDAIEKIAETDPPSSNRYEEGRAMWEKCVLLEKGFWDMAMNLS